jgi:hypothetical protein
VAGGTTRAKRRVEESVGALADDLGAERARAGLTRRMLGPQTGGEAEEEAALRGRGKDQYGPSTRTPAHLTAAQRRVLTAFREGRLPAGQLHAELMRVRHERGHCPPPASEVVWATDLRTA